MRRVLLMACAIFASIVGSASGGSFPTHSRLIIDSFNNPTVAPYHLIVDEEAATFGSENVYHGIPVNSILHGQTFNALHLAVARAEPDYLLGALMISESINSYDSMYSSGLTTAYWRDVATIPLSPVDVPVIRLKFSAVGELENIGIGTRSSIAFDWQTQVRDWGGAGSSGPTQAIVQLDGPGDFDADGWDSINIAAPRFTGTFHIDVPYDAELTGYSWVLSLTAASRTHHGDALSRASAMTLTRSVRLEAVTDLDGVPLRVVAFESGLRYVPEPVVGSLLAPVLGLATILYRRRAWL